MAFEKKVIHLEFRRQLFHIIYGLLFATFIYLGILGLRGVLAIILIGLIISLFSLKWKIPLVSWFLERFEREDQLKKFPGRGAIFFALGVFLALLLFPEKIALASIMVLTGGDSFSHLVGRFYGKYKFHFNKIKNYEGFLAGIVFGGLGAWMFVDFWYAFAASVVAMFFEMLDISLFEHKLDDNLFIPLLAGATITLLMGL